MPAGGGGHVRPPLACLQRYQQLLAVAGKEPPKFKSTDEGIARLAPLVAKHGSTWKVGAGSQRGAGGGAVAAATGCWWGLMPAGGGCVQAHGMA